MWVSFFFFFPPSILRLFSFVNRPSLFQDAAESHLNSPERREKPRKMVGFLFDSCRFHDIFRCSDTNNNMSTHWSLCLSPAQRRAGRGDWQKPISVKTWLRNVSFSYSQLQMRWHKTAPPPPTQHHHHPPPPTPTPVIISKLRLIKLEGNND